MLFFLYLQKEHAWDMTVVAFPVVALGLQVCVCVCVHVCVRMNVCVCVPVLVMCVVLYTIFQQNSLVLTNVKTKKEVYNVAFASQKIDFVKNLSLLDSTHVAFTLGTDIKIATLPVSVTKRD